MKTILVSEVALDALFLNTMEALTKALENEKHAEHKSAQVDIIQRTVNYHLVILKQDLEKA